MPSLTNTLLADALNTNRTYQILISSEIRKISLLYYYNLEKQRVLNAAISLGRQRELAEVATYCSRDFGVSIPLHEEDIELSRSRKLKCGPFRTTSAVRRRIRLFRESTLIVDEKNEKPPDNIDLIYINNVLENIPRVHYQEKFSPLEKACLKKALQLRVQMKLTQRACDNFSKLKEKGQAASDRYSREYKRIKNIDDETIQGSLEHSDWPFIAHLLFCQTEPDRSRIQGEQPKRAALDCQIFWDGIETSNRTEWNEVELARLYAIATKYKFFNWVRIALDLGTSRSPVDCLRQYQLKYNKNLKKSDPWTQEEDDRMTQVIKAKCGDKDFLSTSAHMEGRNQMQCFLRWRNTLRPGIKMRQKFRPEEDICLYLAVVSRGQKWKQLAPHLDDVTGPGRTDVNCRERFVNFMDPKLFFQEFSKSEEKMVDELMVKHFAERINPPPERRNKKYSLKWWEWKFLAGQVSKSGTKKSAYQVKRTWHDMRRRVRSQKRSARKNLAKTKKRKLEKLIKMEKKEKLGSERETLYGKLRNGKENQNEKAPKASKRRRSTSSKTRKTRKKKKRRKLGVKNNADLSNVTKPSTLSTLSICKSTTIAPPIKPPSVACFPIAFNKPMIKGNGRMRPFQALHLT